MNIGQKEKSHLQLALNKMLLRDIKKWSIKEIEGAKDLRDMIKVLTYYLERTKHEKKKSIRNYNTTFKRRKKTLEWYGL